MNILYNSYSKSPMSSATYFVFNFGKYIDNLNLNDLKDDFQDDFEWHGYVRESCCIVKKELRIKSGSIYEAHVLYCKQEHITKTRKGIVLRAIVERYGEPKKIGGYRFYVLKANNKPVFEQRHVVSLPDVPKMEEYDKYQTMSLSDRVIRRFSIDKTQLYNNLLELGSEAKSQYIRIRGKNPPTVYRRVNGSMLSVCSYTIQDYEEFIDKIITLVYRDSPGYYTDYD